jgi:hypothetical protein
MSLVDRIKNIVGYAVVVVLCGVAMACGGGGSSQESAAPESTASNTQADSNSPLGRLEQLGQKLEETNKRMEAAQQSGDAGAQVAAAMEGLGALFGGGSRVEPLELDQLRPFAPDRFSGLPRTNSSAEKTGMAGLMVSRLEVTYGDGASKTIRLEISDTGGISGVMALAGWMGIQGEKEDASGIERTQKVGGRIVHEKISKTGGTNEYGLVIGDRFVVSASGEGVTHPELRTAVSNLNLSGLEALKTQGVQR